jgi:hypothetical protein
MAVAPHALTLGKVRERLQFFDCYLVVSPPAPEGMMYFVGNRSEAAYFPYAKGPIYYLAARPLDALIPAPQIAKILRHLEFEDEKVAAFWSIREERPPSPNLPTVAG